MGESRMSGILEMARKVYHALEAKQPLARRILGRDALTLSEKILIAHMIPERAPEHILRGQTILGLQPDRVAMQDATAQMAILQFMQSNRSKVAVPTTVHCDHLIRAQEGAAPDNIRAEHENFEVYEFL